jgi:hypothetical protein
LELDFTGVAPPEVIENEKTALETRAYDINSDDLDRKNTGKSAV